MKYINKFNNFQKINENESSAYSIPDGEEGCKQVLKELQSESAKKILGDTSKWLIKLASGKSNQRSIFKIICDKFPEGQAKELRIDYKQWAASPTDSSFIVRAVDTSRKGNDGYFKLASEVIKGIQKTTSKEEVISKVANAIKIIIDKS